MNTFPAPQIICRVTRNGVRMSVEPPQLLAPTDQVVLVAAIGVPGGVSVVLEQEDVPGDAFLAQPEVGVHQQPLDDSLARLVVRDQVHQVVALRGGVLRMATYVQIEASTVAQEHVTASSPGHHAPEQVARYLVGRQPPLPADGARDAVLSLDPKYPPVHTPNLRSSSGRRYNPGVTMVDSQCGVSSLPGHREDVIGVPEASLRVSLACVARGQRLPYVPARPGARSNTS